VTEAAGEVRYTRSGAEFRVVTVAEVVAGVDPAEWWQTCPECTTPVQGGPAALAGHRRRVHEGDLRTTL
jgi:hypothetical protein